MKNKSLKVSCLIAVFYFGNTAVAQQGQKDSLKEQKIEEVVMIGYGTAKKVDLTSSIATVKAADIVKTPSGQATQALQGKVAGVQISSFGSPGDAPKVNIRGMNSLSNDGQPLYVVDGVFVDSIDFLAPGDIQDFTILKDASASAIYGVRASNGVVIITTKGGAYNRKAKLSYDTYYGIQQAANVTKMANAEQYANFAFESGSATEIASVNAAIARYGRSRINPNIPDVNTDWYKEALRIAPITGHNLSFEGGSEKIAYALGGDYFYQQGILNMKNDFQRFNVRAKIDVKARDWLTVGASMVYSRSQQQDEESSAWRQIYYAVPIMPVYDYSYTNATINPYSDGRAIGYRSIGNPFSLMENSDILYLKNRLLFNAYAEFSIIPKDLKFKTSLNHNSISQNQRKMALPYYVHDQFRRTLSESSITRGNVSWEDYYWDNTLTYTKSFSQHDLTLMAGTSYRDQYYRGSYISGNFYEGSPFNRFSEQTWYIQNTDIDSRTGNDFGTRFYGVSYFGRFQYKYANKYIAYATYRMEGSNKFKDDYVQLPAFGLSWVASEESFLKDVSWLNLLKFRAGWGRLANEAIPINRIRTASSTNTVFDDQYLSGFQFATYNDNLGWEYTEETNVGATAEFLGRKLTLEADYFVKDAKDLYIDYYPVVGTEVSRVSMGEMRNKGFEFTVGYKGKIGEDFGYNISANFSAIDNEVTSLAGQPYIDRGSAEFRQRLAVGQPVNSFYGWEMTGVYQNAAEIAADPTAQYAINTQGVDIKPGDFKFKDVNGDGMIDASDRVYLGGTLPTHYYGASLGLNYKNWDLSAALYGQGGNTILNRNRGEVIWTQGLNVDAEMAINRWHGEGTTNEFPSSEGYRKAWNQKLSKFFLQDGDFLRIQNIQLGYTLKSSDLPEMRFTITADRPFLWSKSNDLMNPEIGIDGINAEVYPTPSVFSFGYSIKF
ncbi:MAG: SusC/RagA family TonB-linked outer membrane protein [Bergeyella sp.]